MSPPCSPIGETTPRTTSSTRSGSRVGLRTLISSSRPTIRSTGLTSCSVPAALPLPRGVRMWSYTNASAMASYSVMGNRAIRACALDCDTITVTVKAAGPVAEVTDPPGRTRRPMDDSGEAPRELLTLDELTARVGMSVRNIRFYATKGLVPPPIRRGRSGYYSRDHVARLELVSELQAHGFTLSAIEKYLARIPADASPETIALHRTLLAPWMAELPETLSRRELGRRAGRPLSDDDLDTLNALGIVFPTKQGKYQVAIAHLSVGVALLDLGMPLDAALAAQDIFTEHGRKVAEELTDLFRTKVWPAYKEGDSTPEQLREVVERFK